MIALPLRGVLVALLCGALETPAVAARHAPGPVGHDGPSVSIQFGHARGNDALKTFVFPGRKRNHIASPPADLPFFVNPLLRRRMALAPTAPATPIEAADAR